MIIMLILAYFTIGIGTAAGVGYVFEPDHFDKSPIIFGCTVAWPLVLPLALAVWAFNAASEYRDKRDGGGE